MTATAGAATAPRFGTLREHLPWAVLALAAVAAASAYSAALTPPALAGSGRWWLGAWSALGFLSAYIYAARKRLGLGRFHPLRPWYVAHAWLTAAGFVVGLHHAGFALGGAIESALTVSFGLSLVSGLTLALVHRRFKRGLLAIEREHLLPEDIDEAIAHRTLELADLKAAAPPLLATLIEREVILPLSRAAVRRRLRQGRSALVEIEASRAADLAPRLGTAEDRAIVQRAIAAALDRQSLIVQAGLHGIKHIAIAVHLVISSTALALLLVHFFTVLYY